jgi:outer membrane protein W
MSVQWITIFCLLHEQVFDSEYLFHVQIGIQYSINQHWWIQIDVDTSRMINTKSRVA